MHPQAILDKYSAKYKGAWQGVELCRKNIKDEKIGWADYCFLPSAFWIKIVSGLKGVNTEDLELVDVTDAQNLAAVGTWRYTKGIYRVDDRIVNDLKDTSIKGSIPFDVFFHMPEWCVYFDTRGQLFSSDGSQIIGFFAHLDFIYNEEVELQFSIQLENGHMFAIFLNLIKGKNIEECLMESYNDFNIEDKEMLIHLTHNIVSFVLFLCQSEPDSFTADKFEINDTKSLRFGRVSKSNRLLEARKCRNFEVGKKTADKIDKAMTGYTGDGTKQRPHLRRAHWHGFWSGARIGTRTKNYKWIPPIFVNSEFENE